MEGERLEFECFVLFQRLTSFSQLPRDLSRVEVGNSRISLLACLPRLKRNDAEEKIKINLLIATLRACVSEIQRSFLVIFLLLFLLLLRLQIYVVFDGFLRGGWRRLSTVWKYYAHFRRERRGWRHTRLDPQSPHVIALHDCPTVPRAS